MEEQEEKKAQPLSQVQAEQPESQAKPPQQPHWYIAVVNYRHENRCADNLSRLGYETYVAAQKETPVAQSPSEVGGSHNFP